MMLAICREQQQRLTSPLDLAPYGAARRPHLKQDDLDGRARIAVSAFIGRDGVDGEREFLTENLPQQLGSECKPRLRTTLIDGQPHGDDFIEVEPDDRQTQRVHTVTGDPVTALRRTLPAPREARLRQFGANLLRIGDVLQETGHARLI